MQPTGGLSYNSLLLRQSLSLGSKSKTNFLCLRNSHSVISLQHAARLRLFFFQYAENGCQFYCPQQGSAELEVLARLSMSVRGPYRRKRLHQLPNLIYRTIQQIADYWIANLLRKAGGFSVIQSTQICNGVVAVIRCLVNWQLVDSSLGNQFPSGLEKSLTRAGDAGCMMTFFPFLAVSARLQLYLFAGYRVPQFRFVRTREFQV